MAYTTTSNLGLRVDAGLTANAKYNLNRIDTLGASLTTDATETVVFRSREDLIFRPHDASIGGDGIGGSVSFGSSGQPLSSVQFYVDELDLDGALSLFDQASGGAYSLLFQYKSDLSGAAEAAANRTIYFDTDGADRELVFAGDFSLTGNLTLTVPVDTSWTLPLDVGANNYVLTTNGAGTLSWAPAGSGTVTSVALSLPAEFDLSGSPVTDAGTLTATYADQTQNLVFASPIGTTGTPSFRALALSDLPALDTDDITEATNLYYTDARFDTRLATKTTADLAEGANLYYTQARFDSAFSAKDTDDLSEGTNLYYTQARFDSAFGAKSTTDLAEGTNLYYTDARAQTAAGQMVNTTWVNGDGLTKVFNHGLTTTNVIIDVYDIDSGETVEVDTKVRTDANTVTLTASAAPTGTGWRILVRS